MQCTTTNDEEAQRVAAILEDIRFAHKEKGHEVVRLRLEHREEALNVMAESFGGTSGSEPEPVFDWALGAPLRGAWDSAERKTWMRWYMKWSFNTGLTYGMVIGVRDLASSGKLMSVTVVLPPGHARYADTRSWQKSHMWRLALMAGSPQPDVLQPSRYPANASARLEALTNAMIERHHQAERATLDGEHGYWYVYVQAVSPSFQGRGCTRTALEAVAALANSSSDTARQCYLEAGSERNARIYGKLGYKIIDELDGEKVVDPKLLLDGGKPPTVRLMARPAAAASGA